MKNLTLLFCLAAVFAITVSCGSQTYPKCMIFTTDTVVTKCGIIVTYNNGNGYMIESGQVDLKRTTSSTNGVHLAIGENVYLGHSGLLNHEFTQCDNLMSGYFYSLNQPDCVLRITPNNTLQ